MIAIRMAVVLSKEEVEDAIELCPQLKKLLKVWEIDAVEFNDLDETVVYLVNDEGVDV
jgi:hypothetical protein